MEATSTNSNASKEYEKLASESLGNINAISPHEILGVTEDATKDEVKRAWRKMMRSYHPDVKKTPDATEISKKINSAYDMLLSKFKVKGEVSTPQTNDSDQNKKPSAEMKRLLNESSSLEAMKSLGASIPAIETMQITIMKIHELNNSIDENPLDEIYDPPENLENDEKEWSLLEKGLMGLCFIIDLSQGGYGTQKLMEKWVRDAGFPNFCQILGIDPSKFIELLDRSDSATFVFQMTKKEKIGFLPNYTPAQLYELIRSLPPIKREQLLTENIDSVSEERERLSKTDVQELIIKPLQNAGGRYAEYISQFTG